jgi:hypothetical protein
LKFVALDENLYRYVTAHRSRSCDPVLDDLRAETEKLVPRGMLIAANRVFL